MFSNNRGRASPLAPQAGRTVLSHPRYPYLQQAVVCRARLRVPPGRPRRSF